MVVVMVVVVFQYFSRFWMPKLDVHSGLAKYYFLLDWIRGRRWNGSNIGDVRNFEPLKRQNIKDDNTIYYNTEPPQYAPRIWQQHGRGWIRRTQVQRLFKEIGDTKAWLIDWKLGMLWLWLWETWSFAVKDGLLQRLYAIVRFQFLLWLMCCGD